MCILIIIGQNPMVCCTGENLTSITGNHAMHGEHNEKKSNNSLHQKTSFVVKLHTAHVR